MHTNSQKESPGWLTARAGGPQTLDLACAMVGWYRSAEHGSLRHLGEPLRVCQLLQSVWDEEEIVPLFANF